jgi:phytoene dehydrogenase-like protein
VTSPPRTTYDAVVVGAGPNGLAAAVTLARAGKSVLVVEAAATIGGGSRTSERTLPGFRHDVCSAIHPMAVHSPFFRSVPLHEHGLEWVPAPIAVAHAFDDGSAAALHGSIEETARSLGPDSEAYARLVRPIVEGGDSLFDSILDLRSLPRAPFALVRFGLAAMRSALGVASRFRGANARALYGGCAAHAITPLDLPFSAAIGLALLVAGHVRGWPCARGGSQAIVDALASLLRANGGEILTEWRVQTIDELPRARAYLLDVAPRALASIAGERLPADYVRALRAFRHGPGSFKIDYALGGAIPWRAEACRRAGTVHVGGTIEEIARSERAVWEGEHAERPFVIVAQQSILDETRAPSGKHTAWAYCHVPNGSTLDVTARVEAEIERRAPGFRDLVLARVVTSPRELEAYDANCVGGDVGGGANDVAQLFARPVARLVPWSTPDDAIWICSSSTPPGGGVHGMCGHLAATAALKKLWPS